MSDQVMNVEIRRGASPLGIAALVLGIIACLGSWIPFLGLLSIPLALIGLLLGFIGFIMAAVNKKTGFAFPVSGGVICVIAIAIAIASTGGGAKTLSDIAAQNQQTKQTVVSRTTSSGSQKTPPPAESAPDAQSPTPAEVWASAASAVQQGDAQVQVVSVGVGKVSLKDMFGDSQQSTDDLLMIRIKVTNTSAGKKLDYRTWRGANFSFGEDFGSLTDDYGNTYKRITFGASTKPTGAVESESIYPGKSISDVLVFEQPVEAMKWLHLKLPAKNFDGDGMLRFEIPSGMVKR